MKTSITTSGRNCCRKLQMWQSQTKQNKKTAYLRLEQLLLVYHVRKRLNEPSEVQESW